VRPFDGDLDDYQKYLLDTARAQAKALRDANSAGKKAAAAPAPVAVKPVAAAAPPASPAPASRDGRKADAQARQGRSDELKPLRKELNRVDNRLGVLFADRTAIEASLSAGGLTPAQLADNGKKLKALVEEISLLEGQWLELSTQVDELSARAV
jgi:ATP-binding cassette subfamily F protein 3